jgi:hypothetical protein
MNTKSRTYIDIVNKSTFSGLCCKVCLFVFIAFASLQANAQVDTIITTVENTSPTKYDTLENIDDGVQEGIVAPPGAAEDEEVKEFETDFEKHSVKQIIDHSNYQSRQAYDSTRYKNDDAYWYMNYKPEPKKEEKEEEHSNNSSGPSFLASKGFSVMMWVLFGGAFIGILVWFLQTNNLLPARQNRKVNQQSDVEEEMGDNIFEMKFSSLLEKAKLSGNYPLAIRLHYLQTIRTMNDKGLIQYKLDKTNMDYVFSLFKTQHYDAFFSITRMYEYAWFGEYPVGQSQYQIIETKFTQFNQQIA